MHTQFQPDRISNSNGALSVTFKKLSPLWGPIENSTLGPCTAGPPMSQFAQVWLRPVDSKIKQHAALGKPTNHSGAKS